MMVIRRNMAAVPRKYCYTATNFAFSLAALSPSEIFSVEESPGSIGNRTS